MTKKYKWKETNKWLKALQEGCVFILIYVNSDPI